MNPCVRLRIETALARIQISQTEISLALEQLSVICGAAPIYSEGRDLYDRVHEYWYKVAGLRDIVNRLRVDTL